MKNPYPITFASLEITTDGSVTFYGYIGNIDLYFHSGLLFGFQLRITNHETQISQWQSVLSVRQE